MRNGFKIPPERLFQYLRLRYLLPLLLAVTSLEAARKNPESYYQEQAAGVLDGHTEVVLPNGTRCDILTDKYAIEVEFADKWAEAIGQSLNYAAESGNQAVIILIIESPSDEKYLLRLEQVTESFRLPITVLAVRIHRQPDIHDLIKIKPTK